VTREVVINLCVSLPKRISRHVYGGAGVQVEYLSHELVPLTPVKVRLLGTADFHKTVYGATACSWMRRQWTPCIEGGL
jgi:hypothetical protein